MVQVCHNELIPRSRRVLMVLHKYPPAGGGGVQRGMRFVSALPSQGWAPTVLTTAAIPGKPRDASLLAELPQDIAVHRVPPADPWRPYRWRKRFWFLRQAALRLRARLHFPDARIGWVEPALARAREVHAAMPFDAVFTSSLPFSSHLVGLELHAASGLPWVADFRDPWTGNPSLHLEGETLERHRALEQRVLRAADAVVSVSEGITNTLRASEGREPNKFHTIPNGYNPALFQGEAERIDSGFTIVFSGSFYEGLQPDTFFDALNRLAVERSPVLDDLRVVVAGKLAAERLARLKRPERVEFRGYVQHAESVRLVRGADLLLLIIPESFGRGCMTGKIFEYLAADKPVLAMVPPDGEAADLLRRANAGTVVAPDDAAAVACAIGEYHARWKSGAALTPRNRECVEAYAEPVLGERLARVLDRAAR